MITELNIEKLEARQGGEFHIATGVITDESGSANFKLKGDHTKLLKLNGTFAFRNGKSMVIEERIQLELDKFGKVSVEEVKVKADKTKANISDFLWEKKKRNE